MTRTHCIIHVTKWLGHTASYMWCGDTGESNDSGTLHHTSNIWLGHTGISKSHIIKSCCIHEWVMFKLHMWMSHVAYVNASRGTFECVMSNLWKSPSYVWHYHAPCHELAYKRGISLTRMSHRMKESIVRVTWLCALSHMCWLSSFFLLSFLGGEYPSKWRRSTLQYWRKNNLVIALRTHLSFPT